MIQSKVPFAALSAFVVVAALPTLLVARQEPKPAAPAQTQAPVVSLKPDEAVKVSPEEAAVLKAAEAFVKAYNAADGRAIGALYVENAEIAREDAPPVKGRAEIQKLFETTFANEPGARIELLNVAVRFLTPELAVEEGTAHVVPPADRTAEHEPARSRYSVHYAKQADGRWLQASVRDWSEPEPTVAQRLSDLEWMVGEWVDEHHDGLVETTCRWDESGKYLLRDFKVKHSGQPTLSGVERVGWDPLTKQIKSWTFDSEGGHAESLWTKAGADWVLKSRGVFPLKAEALWPRRSPLSSQDPRA